MSPTVTTMKMVSRAARISTASRANSYPVTPKRNSRSRCLAGPAPRVILGHPHPCTVRLDPSGGRPRTHGHLAVGGRDRRCNPTGARRDAVVHMGHAAQHLAREHAAPMVAERSP